MEKGLPLTDPILLSVCLNLLHYSSAHDQCSEVLCNGRVPYLGRDLYLPWFLSSPTTSTSGKTWARFVRLVCNIIMVRFVRFDVPAGCRQLV